MKAIKYLVMIAAIVVTYSAYSNDIDYKKAIGKQSEEVCIRPGVFGLVDEMYCVEPYECITFDMMIMDDMRVSEVVSSMVEFPIIDNQKQEGIVIVEYHVEYNGKVFIDQMNTNNPLLGKYVKEQIEKVFLKAESGPEKKYYAKFHFEIL